MELHQLFLAVFFTVTLAVTVSADTPANCTYEEIRGTWIFQFGPRNKDKTVNCSKPFPTPGKSISVKLTYPDVAVDQFNNVGTWTLIYNQGFEVVIAGMKYFGFSHFVNSTSYCDTVRGGWAHDVLGRKWACFNGKRTESAVKISNQPEDEKNILFKSSKPLINSEEMITQINKAQTSWTAKHYKQFDGFTTEDFIRLAGGRKSQIFSRPVASPLTSEQRNIASSFPKSFDWRNVDGVDFVSPVRDQGGCGSCYAFASVAMAEARVKIQTNNTQKPNFSPQDIVECSNYSQGCEGGFPYLVAGKYAEDYGLVLARCNPYKGEDGPCTTDQSCARHYFTDYSYVGGYYGGCNDVLMQEAIYLRGPVAVSFMVYKDFMNYAGGVYHHTGDATQGVDRFNPFVITNHVVLVVGWGQLSDQEGGTKYWIVKNSWGTSWGLDGFFLIRRGTDECGIESIAVETTPIYNFDKK